MAESIDALPRERRPCGRRAEAPPRAARKAAGGCPRWLLEALARRGLRPSAVRPVHHLLTDRDLPEDVEEHEKVSLGTTHDALERGLRDGIWLRYQARPDVLVAADLLVYFDGPQPDRTTDERVAPDLMVAFDVPKRARRTYAVWEEGKAPDFVLEILSPATWRRDVAEKPARYRRMGAREYFLFDPVGRVEPRLRGWRFGADEEAVPLVDLAGGMSGMYSETLGLHLCHTQPWPTTDHHLPGAGKLRWHDPATGTLLGTLADLERRAETAEGQRDTAERQRDTAERQRDEQTRRAETAEGQRDTAERQRDEQTHRAETAERQRAEEAAARRLLEERVAALEARLR